MLRPLYDRIVVKRVAEEERTKGGLYIPDQNKEKPAQGEVIAIGQGRRLESGALVPLEVAVGDKVLFGKYSGTEIEIDDQKLLILREDEVMGVVTVNPGLELEIDGLPF
jgi:chaperonin GroES